MLLMPFHTYLDSRGYSTVVEMCGRGRRGRVHVRFWFVVLVLWLSTVYRTSICSLQCLFNLQVVSYALLGKGCCRQTVHNHVQCGITAVDGLLIRTATVHLAIRTCTGYSVEAGHACS